MRGKAHKASMTLHRSGITPAYAGKSFQSDQSKATAQDHPRLCGEKLKTAVKDGVYTGSPPPMRGKGDRFPALDPFRGITPAYAGKSAKLIKTHQNE